MSPLACVRPEIIPGYTIRERIGAGGYGEVWMADAPGGLVKAVKFVYGCLEGERASRELKALSRIKEVRHPFLLSLERIEVIDGQLIIVTELADANLMNRFEQCTAAGTSGIPRNELLVYMSDTADALDYMRDTFSLQHLDVKPENLLILSGRIKVADFGLVKDIQDVTVSLVGGMTPVYAAPEVFTGHPSLHSDQYSLAVVYQEMLTGVLPFSGRDHAQLAAQHQHSSPRLAPLPPEDRLIIARALAKNPKDRFSSCRELVDQLRSGAKSGNAANRSDLPLSDLQCPRPDTSSQKTVDTVSHEPSKSGRAKPQKAAEPAVASGPTVSFENVELPSSAVIDDFASEDLWSELKPSPSTSSDWPLSGLGPAGAIKDLPPLDTAPGAWRQRPCLVIGLGGTAGRVLSDLRQRWSDQFGDLSSMPSLQMLLVDSDRRSIVASSGGSASHSSWSSETLTMPLRAQDDYHAASEKYLRWLRRRWLCRIPRSHSAEGLRPLGRLALVDHGPELFARLKTALSSLASAEAIHASDQHVGQEEPAVVPQIILVASISGGTGSGMLLDMAYAVRKVLADISHADFQVTGVLLHSTGHNPHDKLLARANACACLRELQRFGRGNGYPGDADFGLPAFGPDVRPFDAIRVVHLGDGLNQQEFDQAQRNVAQFLHLATATAGSVFFESDGDSRTAETAVRTCGLCRVGWTRREFVAKAADLLCQRTVRRWLGEVPGEIAAPLPSLERLMAQIRSLTEAHPEADAALDGLADRYAALLEAEIGARQRSGGGVLAARAAAQAALDGLRKLEMECGERRQRVESLLAPAEVNLSASPTGPLTQPKSWFALSGSRKASAGGEAQKAKMRVDLAILQSAAAMLRRLKDRVATTIDPLKHLQFEINGLLETFAPTADDDIATFIDVSHPELVVQLDEEWRSGALVDPIAPSATTTPVEPPRRPLLERLRLRGCAKVLDTLRRGDFRDLLPAGLDSSSPKPGLLKSCLDSAAPRLNACGGSRRLWLIGAGDALSASLRAAIELDSTQTPSVAIDPDSDFMVGWEVEGMSLLHVAASLIDNQRDAAELASRLHTRLDIAW